MVCKEKKHRIDVNNVKRMRSVGEKLNRWESMMKINEVSMMKNLFFAFTILMQNHLNFKFNITLQRIMYNHFLDCICQKISEVYRAHCH